MCYIQYLITVTRNHVKPLVMSTHYLIKYLNLKNSVIGWYAEKYQKLCAQFRTLRNYFGQHYQLSIPDIFINFFVFRHFQSDSVIFTQIFYLVADRALSLVIKVVSLQNTLFFCAQGLVLQSLETYHSAFSKSCCCRQHYWYVVLLE